MGSCGGSGGGGHVVAVEEVVAGNCGGDGVKLHSL